MLTFWIEKTATKGYYCSGYKGTALVEETKC